MVSQSYGSTTNASASSDLREDVAGTSRPDRGLFLLTVAIHCLQIDRPHIQLVCGCDSDSEVDVPPLCDGTPAAWRC
jgi:hypothetical protein